MTFLKSLDSVLLVSAISEEMGSLVQIFPNNLVVGVGNLTAALQLSEYLNNHPRIEEILFIGSCGTYDPKLCSFPNTASGDEYFYHELGEFYGYSHRPDLLPHKSNSIRGSIGDSIVTKLSISSYSVNSPNSLSLVDKSAIPNFPSNIILENMEVFGLSLVAEKKKKGFTSLFAVTNQVGPKGSLDWKKNYKIQAADLIAKITGLF